MEKLNREMDQALQERIAALQANDDETGDGRIDTADMKLQLDRIEAQLELQDKQNRTLLHNQRVRFVWSIVLVVLLCVFVAFMWYRMDMAYQNIQQTCAQVNEIAATLQTSLDELDNEELTTILKEMPAVMEQLSSIDVEALNNVLGRLPAIMDSITALQTQVNNLASTFGSLRGLFGG